MMSKDLGASPLATGPAPSGLSRDASQAKPLVPSADLFGEELAAPKRKLCLRTEFLKERYRLHPDWVWHSFQVIDRDRPPGEWQYAFYEGGVYPWAKQTGKHKGRTNYKRPLPGSEAKVVLNDREYEAWLPTWEARTGQCHLCKGTGQEWRGWSKADGDKWRDCPRCGATGNAPASGIAAQSDETATQAQPERQEPGPKGDAKTEEQ